MKTYRYRGHSRSDPAKYRPAGELEEWKARDPLTVLGDRLAADGILDEAAAAVLRDETQATIDSAAEQAAAAPYLTLEEARDHVYAD